MLDQNSRKGGRFTAPAAALNSSRKLSQHQYPRHARSGGSGSETPPGDRATQQALCHRLIGSRLVPPRCARLHPVPARSNAVSARSPASQKFNLQLYRHFCIRPKNRGRRRAFKQLRCARTAPVKAPRRAEDRFIDYRKRADGDERTRTAAARHELPGRILPVPLSPMRTRFAGATCNHFINGGHGGRLAVSSAEMRAEFAARRAAGGIRRDGQTYGLQTSVGLVSTLSSCAHVALLVRERSDTVVLALFNCAGRHSGF